MGCSLIKCRTRLAANTTWLCPNHVTKTRMPQMCRSAISMYLPKLHKQSQKGCQTKLCRGAARASSLESHSLTNQMSNTYSIRAAKQIPSPTSGRRRGREGSNPGEGFHAAHATWERGKSRRPTHLWQPTLLTFGSRRPEH